MERRNLLKSLAALTIGSGFIVSCEWNDEIYNTDTGQIRFRKRQSEFINILSDIIIPKDNLPIETPESFDQFLSTMINDCSNPEEIKNYGIGYQYYKSFLSDTFSSRLDELTDLQVQELFELLQDESAMTENAKYFFQQTKNNAILHFTTSKYYVQQIEEYEFIPGRYNGCSSI